MHRNRAPSTTADTTRHQVSQQSLSATLITEPITGQSNGNRTSSHTASKPSARGASTSTRAMPHHSGLTHTHITGGLSLGRGLLSAIPQDAQLARTAYDLCTRGQVVYTNTKVGVYDLNAPDESQIMDIADLAAAEGCGPADRDWLILFHLGAPHSQHMMCSDTRVTDKAKHTFKQATIDMVRAHRGLTSGYQLFRKNSTATGAPRSTDKHSKPARKSIQSRLGAKRPSSVSFDPGQQPAQGAKKQRS